MIKLDLAPQIEGLRGDLARLERKVLDPADAPKPRPWWKRFTERKFIAPMLLVIAMVLGVATGKIPWGWEVVAGVVALVWSWIQGEVKLDLARLPVPQVPGPIDDIVRALQKIVLLISGETPKPDTPS